MSERVSEVAVVGEGGASPADRVRSVRETLRRHGLRYSRPREALMAFMLEERRHINAEALQQALRDRGEEMSLSTVYLNLGVLVEVGLLREFKGAQGESVYDATTEPHDHLICKETGEVIDVPLPTIDGDLLPLYLKRYVEQVTGWQVDEVRLSLLGRPPRR